MFLLIFFCGFSAKRNISCNYRNKHFSSRKKTKISSTGFIRLRFQCYNCKSGIVIFSWVALSVQLDGVMCHWFVLGHTRQCVNNWYINSHWGFFWRGLSLDLYGVMVDCLYHTGLLKIILMQYL